MDSFCESIDSYRIMTTNPDSKKIQFVPYDTNPENPGFVRYLGSQILTLNDSFWIVSHESRKFLRFSTVCLDLNREVHGFLYFLVEISQSVKTFHHFQTQKASTMSRFLDKSWQCLNKSWQSRHVSTISTKILTRQSLDWKISILKIWTKIKKSWSLHEG